MTLDDVRLQSDLQRSSCTFAADYSSGLNAPQFDSFGPPGTPGFNVRLVSLSLAPAAGLTRPCPADSTPTGIILETDQGLVIGQPIHSVRGEVDFPNGAVFVTNNEFFEFKLNTLNLNTKVATADFRLLLRNDANPNDTRIIFASGSFTMPVHAH
jgi:hypothetical protein